MTFPDNILRRMRLPGSPWQLAVIRVAFGLQIFYAVNSRVFDLLLAVGDDQGLSTVFPEWFDALVARRLVPSLIIACKLLSVFMVIGLFTRVVVPLLTASFIVLFSFYYVGANAPIHWLYLWFPMLTLCFSGSAHVFSVDAWLWRHRAELSRAKGALQYRWPAELMVGWFVYIYFAAGIAKVLPVSKGLLWLNGQTSKEILYDRFLDSPMHYIFREPLFDYSGSSALYIGLTVAAVVLELGTIVLLFTSRWHVAVLSLIMAMHLFLYLVGVAGFAQTALVLGVALIDPRFFRRWDERPAPLRAS